MSQRALRRHHRARILARTVLFLTFREPWNQASEIYDRALRRAENRTPCSCPMCCNPRRSFFGPRRTRGELRTDLDLVEARFGAPRVRSR